MIWGANLGLLVVVILFIVGLVGIMFKDNVLDFVKANFGLLVLLLLFMTLLAVSFHIFHEQSGNPLAKDFLAWLEQKAGEVLAAVMTLIVGVRAANGRAGDKNGATTNGDSTTGNPTTGTPH